MVEGIAIRFVGREKMRKGTKVKKAMRDMSSVFVWIRKGGK